MKMTIYERLAADLAKMDCPSKRTDRRKMRENAEGYGARKKLRNRRPKDEHQALHDM